ncbi:MAG: SgcJ/EcaC family oxidoreductase [Chloroflexota bacterium]
MANVLATDEAEIRALQQRMWDCWNSRDAAGIAALYADDGNVIGYDGSQINGKAEIEANMAAIFRDHTPATYVGKIREVRWLSPDIALLRAVAGMIPPGKSELNPERNAIISLVAVKQVNQWKIALYHNTPARFDGRPEVAQQLTDELRQLV